MMGFPVELVPDRQMVGRLRVIRRVGVLRRDFIPELFGPLQAHFLRDRTVVEDRGTQKDFAIGDRIG